MPLPEPTDNETTTEFTERCMADSVMIEEYADEQQRYAVCLNQYAKAYGTDPDPKYLRNNYAVTHDV